MRKDPSIYERAYKQSTKTLLTIEAAPDTSTVVDTANKVNK